MPLVGAGLRIEHHDPAVLVTVGGIHLLGDGIDGDIGRRAEPLRRVAVMPLAGLADLHHELAVHGEFQELAVGLAVAGKPDIIIGVDIDAVLAFRPLVARSGAAPGAHQIAGLVEDENRRRGNAALGLGRIVFGGTLAGAQRTRPMDDPDTIEPVDRDAGDLADDPVVGQRLRPQRVDLELRNGRLVLGSRRRWCKTCKRTCESSGETRHCHQSGNP